MLLRLLRWFGLPVWLLLLPGPGWAQRPTLPPLPPVPTSLRATLQAAHTSVARNEALLAVAHYYAVHGDTAAGFAYARGAIREAQAARVNSQIANAYQHFTNTYFDLGLLPLAVRWGQAALPLWGEHPGIAITQNTLGLVYVKQGRTTEALQMLNAAYRTSVRAGNVRGQRLADNCRGALYLGADLQDSASFYLLRAAKGFHTLPALADDNYRQESSALYNLGTLAFRRKEYRTASTYTRQALAIRLAQGDSMRIPSTLNNLARASLAADSLAQALRYGRQSAHMATRLHLVDAQIVAWDNLGTAYSRLHQPDSARRCLQRALAITSRGGMRNYRARVLQSQALHAERSQQLAEARQRAEEVAALDSAQRDQPTTLDNLKLLGRLALARHDDATALQYFQRQRNLEVRQATAASSQQMAALRVSFDAERTEQQLVLATARARVLAQQTTLLSQQAALQAQQATSLRLLAQQRETAFQDTLNRRERQRLSQQLLVAQQAGRAEQATRQVQALTHRTQVQAQQARLQAQQQELTHLRTQRERAIIGALAGLGLLVVGAGFWYYRRRQTRQLAAREEQLRQRLAADLHDDVGNLLTQISMQSSLLREITHTPAQLLAHLDQLTSTSRQAAQHMSDVVWGLNQTSQTLPELLDRLRDHAYEVCYPLGIELDVEETPAVSGAQLSPEALQNLYLIFKEALHNVVKHAGATRVTVCLDHGPDGLRLRLADNGRGHHGPARIDGNGLRNMQARAAAVGGTVRYEQPEQGFAVLVTLPEAVTA